MKKSADPVKTASKDKQLYAHANAIHVHLQKCGEHKTSENRCGGSVSNTAMRHSAAVKMWQETIENSPRTPKAGRKPPQNVDTGGYNNLSGEVIVGQRRPFFQGVFEKTPEPRKSGADRKAVEKTAFSEVCLSGDLAEAWRDAGSYWKNETREQLDRPNFSKARIQGEVYWWPQLNGHCREPSECAGRLAG
jgi:hypothetical protein